MSLIPMKIHTTLCYRSFERFWVSHINKMLLTMIAVYTYMLLVALVRS